MTDATERFVRASTPSVMTSRDGLELVGRDAILRRLEGDSAVLAEAVLAFASAPRSRAEIRAHVEELSGAPLGGSTVVDELVSLLLGTGALARETRTTTAGATRARVVIGLGGAVAASHAPWLVQALVTRGCEVRVVASERALRFVSQETLEALTHASVRASMWPDEREPALRVPHVELAAWADVVAIWPATATMISRIATGDCSELVSAVAITTRAPVLVAPSMNESMLDAPSVARNLETLRGDGFHVAGTSLAYEVADAPDRRALGRGGAPDVPALARMIEALARASAPSDPHDAASWEAFHRRVPESEQGWVTDEPDPTVMRLIDAHGAHGSWLWDVGTGHGAIAVAAAKRGFRVVATDVSETALARARDRAGDAPVLWLRDDVTHSALTSVMDVIVDRGTLHTLLPARRADYAAQIEAHTKRGSLVVVTVHTKTSEPLVRSHPMSAAEVEALFGERFEVLESVEGVFAGSVTPPPPCVTIVLRRR